MGVTVGVMRPPGFLPPRATTEELESWPWQVKAFYLVIALIPILAIGIYH